MVLSGHWSDDNAMPCGCIDYHMADCQRVTGYASDYDAPEPDEYSNLDYEDCDHSPNSRYSFDGTIVMDSDGIEWVVCDFCGERRTWESVQND
jgi:hypothetical protein